MNNKEIVIKYSKQLWEQKDLSIIDEIFAEDAIIHSPLNKYKGNLPMKEIAQKWLHAFPDLMVTWDDFIAEGDKVVSSWTAFGTHLGGFYETSPTHREVRYSGVTTYQLKDGKIIQYWALVDMHSILNQLMGYESISEAVD